MSGGELERFEAVQGLVDGGAGLGAGVAFGPVPVLDEELAGGAVGLEVDGGEDAVADEDREGEVAEAAARGGDVGLEEMVVAEDLAEALALDDQRVEGREDVDGRGVGRAGEVFGGGAGCPEAGGCRRSRPGRGGGLRCGRPWRVCAARRGGRSNRG